MNRALRAATMGALLLSPIALSACSAGQVNQTVGQVRDRVGPMEDVGDLALRQVLLTYPEDEGRYFEGDEAQLILSIVNRGIEDDTLIGIEGDAFDGVVVDDGATPVAAEETTDVDVPIPARSAVRVGEDGDVQITLDDLQEELTVGESVDLTFRFEQAGEVTVSALVATPEQALDRGESFDFHHEEEGAGEETAEGVARERESEAGGGHG